MSLFLKAINEISYLVKRADVIGTPRISISFDTDADQYRFMAELNRDINNTIRFEHHHIAKYKEVEIYGIKVRFL